MTRRARDIKKALSKACETIESPLEADTTWRNRKEGEILVADSVCLGPGVDHNYLGYPTPAAASTFPPAPRAPPTYYQYLGIHSTRQTDNRRNKSVRVGRRGLIIL